MYRINPTYFGNVSSGVFNQTRWSTLSEGFQTIVVKCISYIASTYIWFQQIHVRDGSRHLWGNLGFTVLLQAAVLGRRLLLLPLPLLPIGRSEVLRVGAILCEWPAAGVLDARPGGADVTRVAPALVVGVGGRGSTGED